MFKYLNRGISTPVAIGIIAILVVVVGGGILAYQYYYITEKEQPIIQTPATEIPKIETLAPITENSNWKMYADSNFGYSFYYPKTWKISATDTRLTITNFGPTRNDKSPDSISISEVQDSKVFVTCPKFGNTTLYYDNNSNQWMKTSPGAGELYETKPAKVAFNTISGLSVYSSTGRWKTVIIPLSHTKFLVVNITGSGYTTALDLLASAITETGANVPISAISDVISAMEREDELATGVEGTVEETECEKWRKECAEEGENLCGPCGCKSCCPGLVKRDVTYPYRNKNNEVFCLEEMTAYTCVKCGDKICGKGEDWCICPEDCPKPNPEDLQIFIMPE